MISNSPEFYETPVVLIYAVPLLLDGILEPVLWGLEEEGIPSRLEEKEISEAAALAKAAANASMLNVGIGIDKTQVALHYRDLPPQQPLFVIKSEDFTRTNLRRLGANAARLVKGNPLIVPEALLTPEQCQLPM